MENNGKVVCAYKTHLTPERFFSGVLQGVHLQRHTALKGLPARLTGERHVLSVSYREGQSSGHSSISTVYRI